MSSIIPRVIGIYKIVCTETNKVYVGSSHHMHRRWKNHRAELNGHRHKNTYLQNAWDKYGESAFEFVLIEHVDLQFLMEREEYWIAQLHACDREFGYNRIATPTSPNRGVPLSVETKKKLSIAGKGRVFTDSHRANMSIANTGRYYSPETRAKIAAGASRTQKGRKKSPEHRAKIAMGNTGKVFTTERRANISAARMGKGHPQTEQARAKISATHLKSYIVTSPDGQEYRIHGLSKFCEEHGLSVSMMSTVASGNHNHHKDWKCRHAD